MDGTANSWIATRAETLVRDFEAMMSESEGSFEQREATAMTLANAVVRLWIKSELEKMSGRYGDEIVVDKQRYRRHASGSVGYHTLCGAVKVRRNTYRLVGRHNGPTVVPLELEAGILENATPALALSVVQAFASMPLRHYEDEMRAAHRQVPSRSTLERIAKRLGKTLHDELPIIEPVIRASEVMPEHAASISVGIDRTTIPIAEQLPALPERWHRKRKRKRRQPPPITVAYRMAYVATIAVHDKHGSTITSKRIAATADEGPVEMMERLGGELQQLRAQRGDIPILVVQDGAPELWNLVEEWFANFDLPIEMQLIDRYHLDERLAQVAELIERNEKSRREILDTWRRSLDRSDTAIRTICREIDARLYNRRRRTTLQPNNPNAAWLGREFGLVRIPKFTSNTVSLVEGHVGYCKRYFDKMRYASARKRGFPIGSGVTEGACKSVVASRFKRSGQRWFESGASACLQMRTLHLNGRLERSILLHAHLRRESLGLA
jgi:hypothetical protein